MTAADLGLCILFGIIGWLAAFALWGTYRVPGPDEGFSADHPDHPENRMRRNEE